MKQSEINESEWQNPANWHWGVYNSPRDTRVVVPKPLKWTGWTFNFAHTAAYLYLAALLLPAVVVIALIALTGEG